MNFSRVTITHIRMEISRGVNPLSIEKASSQTIKKTVITKCE